MRKMITIISGTNRPNSNSLLISRKYAQHLDAKGQECQVLNLQDLPKDFIFSDMYGERSDEMQAIISRHFDQVEKFVFIIPEYNGGFPGVLKAFIDCIPPSHFHYKKAGLVGLSSGNAGSLRGMDQFSNVLNYLKVNVLFAKPKISQIESLLRQDPDLTDERVNLLLDEHAALMINF